jgi:hypothetical protein
VDVYARHFIDSALNETAVHPANLPSPTLHNVAHSSNDSTSAATSRTTSRIILVFTKGPRYLLKSKSSQAHGTSVVTDVVVHVVVVFVEEEVGVPVVLVCVCVVKNIEG